MKTAIVTMLVIFGVELVCIPLISDHQVSSRFAQFQEAIANSPSDNPAVVFEWMPWWPCRGGCFLCGAAMIGVAAICLWATPGGRWRRLGAGLRQTPATG